MRVIVDPQLCEGNAVCEALAPAVFEVASDWQAKVLQPEVSEENHEVVHRAVESCPRLAISVIE